MIFWRNAFCKEFETKYLVRFITCKTCAPKNCCATTDSHVSEWLEVVTKQR